MSLTRLTLTQRRSSTAVMTADSQSTIGLLEQCLPFAEDRYLHCLHGEPWCPLTMYGVIMLLKIQSGQETHQTAKAACAHRFLDLYHKHFSRQATSDPEHGIRPSEDDSILQTGSVVSPQKMDCDYVNLDMDWMDFNIDWQSGASWDMEFPWDSL
ncbi:hypothetical protein FJTKL_01823 [Diaporthe vaccinii]|uniref:Transcription factor domain-containing protein n=1 Tax=Diaporthe vaccinii TaxID=105482 RepID=A0ABR4F4D2_9PEZI